MGLRHLIVKQWIDNGMAREDAVNLFNEMHSFESKTILCSVCQRPMEISEDTKRIRKFFGDVSVAHENCLRKDDAERGKTSQNSPVS